MSDADFAAYDAACAQPRNPNGCTMSEATQREWNDWATNIARRVAQAKCEALANMIGEEVGKIVEKLRDQAQAALDRRDARIAELEQRIAALEEAVTEP